MLFRSQMALMRGYEIAGGSLMISSDHGRQEWRFVAIALSGEIKTAGQAKKISSHAKLVELFRSIDSPPPPQRRIPWKNVISTRSNLKSAVLILQRQVIPA